MKARIPLALALAMLLLVGMLALVSPSQAAQALDQSVPTIEVLESSPESIFVFDISPDVAEVGQYPIFIMYAWGYLGDPTQRLTVTTSIPAGLDPGGCPDGCVQTMHLVRDPYGGAGLSATLNATATIAGQHTLVAHFLDDMGVSQTLTATLTVLAPPTAVSLTGMSANPKVPQTPWALVTLALLMVTGSLGLATYRRIVVHN